MVQLTSSQLTTTPFSFLLAPTHTHTFFFCTVKSDKFDAIVRSFKYHAGKEGKITLDKFIKIFDGTIDDDLARKIFVTFDHDQDGAIELREYLRMMGISHWGSVDQKLRATFQVFNKSKNDVLSRDEFQQMYVSMVRQKRAAIHFKETGRRFSANSEVLTQDELDAINAKITPLFTKIDVDKSDTIDYDEFVNGYLKYPDECAFFKQF